MISNNIIKIIHPEKCINLDLRKVEKERNLYKLDAVLAGKKEYKAPEEFKNSLTIDAKLDIWSLGLIIYEMMYG